MFREMTTSSFRHLLLAKHCINEAKSENFHPRYAWMRVAVLYTPIDNDDRRLHLPRARKMNMLLVVKIIISITVRAIVENKLELCVIEHTDSWLSCASTLHLYISSSWQLSSATQ